ncbi:uncharacterized protein [Spinacia oleracea]|uniref:Tudor domain-containing protein n=1 Tax=Spinacia oleracea TaxID=3562 RepID=A0A9R0JMN0_SPIOL|nr:uncharacterized protein LOC110780236 [Spinacia oleracea]
MTYRKRVRATAETDATGSASKSLPSRTSSLSEAASQPTKKHATQSQPSQVPKSVIFGPFSPPGTTTSMVAPPCSSTAKSVQQTIRKTPPTGSASNSLEASTKNKIPPKITSKISIQPNIPPSKPLKYPSTSSGQIPPNMPPHVPPSSHTKTSARDSQSQQKSVQEPKENSTKSKSLREYPDWRENVDFDDKEEVMTIDAKGNIGVASGPIQAIDVWSNNGVRYYVEFNDLCQPLRKGGQILVKFIGSLAKMEPYCPVGETDWKDVDGALKGKLIDEIKFNLKSNMPLIPGVC